MVEVDGTSGTFGGSFEAPHGSFEGPHGSYEGPHAK